MFQLELVSHCPVTYLAYSLVSHLSLMTCDWHLHVRFHLYQCAMSLSISATSSWLTLMHARIESDHARCCRISLSIWHSSAIQSSIYLPVSVYVCVSEWSFLFSLLSSLVFSLSLSLSLSLVFIFFGGVWLEDGTYFFTRTPFGTTRYGLYWLICSFVCLVLFLSRPFSFTSIVHIWWCVAC